MNALMNYFDSIKVSGQKSTQSIYSMYEKDTIVTTKFLDAFGLYCNDLFAPSEEVYSAIVRQVYKALYCNNDFISDSDDVHTFFREDVYINYNELIFVKIIFTEDTECRNIIILSLNIDSVDERMTVC